jgi:phosphate transport system substrate-binding protein
MTGMGKHSECVCLRGWIPLLAALALLILVCPAIAGQKTETTLVFAGSGTNLPIVRMLAKAFQRSHPGINIDVPASIGSTSGIRAAADGAIAIGLISRTLRESEKKLGLEVVGFARTPLIIAVHPAVAEENITYAEIIDIYRGKKNRWQNGKEIIVLTREPADSSIEVMVTAAPGFREVYEESQKAKRWMTMIKDLQMNENLARIPNAIGFSDLGAIRIERHRIKPLKVNGVAPTLKNLERGVYPLGKTLSFVFHKEKSPPAARKFVDFARSREGVKILLANGYLPEK